MNAARWQALMHAFGFPANEQTFLALVAAYSETHRHYHTAAHIDACLALLDSHAGLADRRPEVELALWFHDAIYKPLSGDNERRSAEWAGQFLAENLAPREAIDRVRRLVLATAHAAPAAGRDEALLLDIDLSVLGADADAYDAYEAAIRKEYRMVPMVIYRSKRAEVLEGFLRKPAIYLNADFRSEREGRARSNLALALSRLGR
jgi:predicted metal-dependent HD superfamily phosphohydrolase